MKKAIRIIVIIIITIIVIIGINIISKQGKKEKEEPLIKVNTNENVIKDQEVEGLKMTNTSLVYENGTTTLVTEVRNEKEEEITVKRIRIKVKDKEGNILTTLIGTIADTIKPGESRIIETETPLDLSKAESVEYSVEK